ncbi:MAG: hypothetical protein K6B28_07485 [Lachnospiraceae bacterium]|nr:hypothetical protein [Lachnospiraceae bacterium]
MSDKYNTIDSLIDITLAYVKDKALREIIGRIQNAEREYLKAEADARRKVSNEIIESMVSIDIERIKLENTYNNIKNTLTHEGRSAVENLIKILKDQRQELLKKKNEISGLS